MERHLKNVLNFNTSALCKRSAVVQCPFEKCHIVRSNRLEIHILKCAKKYPNHFTCPYNALHRFVDKEEYDHHTLKECPDLRLTVPLKYLANHKQHGNLEPVPTESTAKFNMEFENWDDDYKEEDEEW